MVETVATERKVQVVVSPVTDVLVGLSVLGHPKKYEQEEFSARVRAGMRPRLLANVDRLFDLESYPGVGLLSLLGKDFTQDVPSFLQGLMRLSLSEFVRAMLSFGRIYRGNLPVDKDIEELMANRELLLEFIERNMTVPAEKGEILADLVMNAAETRENLAELIEYLWYVVLQPEAEERAASQRQIADQSLARLAELGPSRLITAMTHLTFSDDKEEYDEYIIAPSSFLGCQIIGTENEKQNAMVLVYGKENDVFQADSCLPDNELSNPEYQAKFYNVLGDPTRLEIVRALVERPHYGQELANKFGKTNATVFHHLSLLQKVDLVHLERIEHRVYYVLNTTRLQQFLAMGQAFLGI